MTSTGSPRHIIVVAFGLLALGAPSGANGQQPEPVGPGIISTDGRHETFPAVDSMDASLWCSVYTRDFGSQSGKGLRFVERVLTLTETCRRQAINVLEYLSAAIVAHHRNDPAPRLLPTG